MGIRVAVHKVKIHVPRDGPKATDLGNLIKAIDSLYHVLAAVEVFESRAIHEGRPRSLPDEYLLRIRSLRFGSKGDWSLFGIDKALKVVLETIRDWRQKKDQEREKTAQERAKTAQEQEKRRQEREKTIAARIANAKEFVALYREIKWLRERDQQEITRMIARDLAEVEENPTKILPR